MFTNCHTISIDLSKTNNYWGALTIIHVNEVPYKHENCSFDGCSASSMGGGLFSIFYQKKRQMTAPLFSIWQSAIAVLCWISAVYEIIPKLTVSENCLLHRLTSYQIYKSDTLTLSNSSCFQINWKDSIYYRKIGMRQNIIRLWYNSMQKWSKTHWNLENWNL